MKKLALLLMLAVGFVSCKYTAPNDRALFNLQGPVHILEEYTEEGEETLCVVFTREGLIDFNESTIPYDISVSSREYGRLLGNVNGYPVTWEFDGDGRLEEEVTKRDEKELTTTYDYKGDSFLPRKIESENIDFSGEVAESVVEPTYPSTDAYGNWTEFQGKDYTLGRTLSYYEDMPNEANCPMDRSIDFEAIMAVIVSLIMLAALGVAAWHMIKENYLTKYRTDYTVAEFSQNRVAQGLSPEMSGQENQLARDLLDEIYDAWTTSTLPDGTEIFCPMTRTAVLLTKKNMAAVIAMNPTDEAVVERLNAFNETLGNAFEREFNGSKPLLWVAGIFGVIGIFFGGFGVAVFLGMGFYWLASRPPLFMTIRKELKGTNTSKSILSSIIAGLFTMVATAKTYKTVTKWSDGSTTTDTDNSETWFSLALMVVVMVMLASFILIFGLVNYVRNYHLYR
uniref:hypothetical protein n=1 Tax=Alistipes sp. TaxID=1872444 RepID=UPI00405712B5